MIGKKRIIGLVLAIVGAILFISSVLLAELMPEWLLLLLIIAGIAAIVLGIILIAKGGTLVDVDYSAADDEEDRIEEIMEDIDEDNELIK
ncbi:MAG: hypothetical protein ACOC44_11570 [Promethearchaeia archaeon]